MAPKQPGSDTVASEGKKRKHMTTVYPHPFTVHCSRLLILIDFTLKVFFHNFGNSVNFLGHF